MPDAPKAGMLPKFELSDGELSTGRTKKRLAGPRASSIPSRRERCQTLGYVVAASKLGDKAGGDRSQGQAEMTVAKRIDDVRAVSRWPDDRPGIRQRRAKAQPGIDWIAEPREIPPRAALQQRQSLRVERRFEATKATLLRGLFCSDSIPGLDLPFNG